MAPTPPLIQRKIALMGYPCVGKSSTVLRFVSGTFPDYYDNTIEDSHEKVFNYLGRQYSLHIVDTAGQHEYSLFPRSCSVDIDGYILVYSIDNRKSFEVLKTIYEKILDYVGEVHIPIVLVGNKLDLQHIEREVTAEEGQKLAREWNAAFLETSAKENQQIDEVFGKLLYEIEKAHGNIKPKQSSCTVS